MTVRSYNMILNAWVWAFIACTCTPPPLDFYTDIDFCENGLGSYSGGPSNQHDWSWKSF